jgi:predicted GH43/DUF377 family glycosyl hydrolase
MIFPIDRLVLAPDDIDLSRSPLAGHLGVETYCLGAFNPALTRLPNGNLLMMVRVAEALRTPSMGGKVHNIRWCDGRYLLDAWPLELADTRDPRKFMLQGGGWKVMALTSLAWLLPVELSPDGLEVIAHHYDKVIQPQGGFQMYGLEDARISKVDDRWLMTTCSVSPERHSTTLYSSENGLDGRFEDVVLDHQNKDMLIFEGLIDGHYGPRPGRSATFISLIRPAASGAPAPRSISPVRRTRSTGSRAANPESVPTPIPSRPPAWAAAPRQSSLTAAG